MIVPVIDLHAHILPGLDDGPATLDDSAAFAAAAVRAGTRVMAATSHVNRMWGLGPAELAAARAQVAERLAADEIELELVQGGEIAPSRLLDLDGESLRGLTLGEGPYLLVECPFGPAAGMDMIVDSVQRRGFQVLLAHPERSASFQRDRGLLARLVDRGALAQVTSASLAGGFGEAAQESALRMVGDGVVHVLASDGHHHALRPPDVLAGVPELRRRFGDVDEQVEWMANRLPAAILSGDEPPERPPLPRHRRRGLRAWPAR
jgi:protein-tyrosine phosphatase